MRLRSGFCLRKKGEPLYQDIQRVDYHHHHHHRRLHDLHGRHRRRQSVRLKLRPTLKAEMSRQQHQSLPIYNSVTVTHAAASTTTPTPPRVKSHRLHELEKRFIAYEQGYVCAMCCTMLQPFFDIDHIVPLSSVHWIGVPDAHILANARSNLQALCCNCHRMKTMREHLLRCQASTVVMASPGPHMTSSWSTSSSSPDPRSTPPAPSPSKKHHRQHLSPRQVRGRPSPTPSPSPMSLANSPSRSPSVVARTQEYRHELHQQQPSHLLATHHRHSPKLTTAAEKRRPESPQQHMPSSHQIVNESTRMTRSIARQIRVAYHQLIPV